MLMVSLTCWLKLNLIKQLVQTGSLLDYWKKQLIKWLHCSPLFFQSSLNQSKGWKSANITPIYKKGNRTGLGLANYRPISLMSVCSKILEHIIYSFISTHLSNHNILSANQHGFRTGQSCDTQLLRAINDSRFWNSHQRPLLRLLQSFWQGFS